MAAKYNDNRFRARYLPDGMGWILKGLSPRRSTLTVSVGRLDVSYTQSSSLANTDSAKLAAAVAMTMINSFFIAF